MRTKVGKWGNSLAIRIPASFAEDASLEDGDEVEIEAREGSLVIRPKKPSLRMADILQRITDENMHAPVDFGPPVGKELL